MKQLSTKENKRRHFILHGKLWQVIIQITIPLAVYGLFNYLYGFFDLLMVAHIGNNEVASVVFIDEIKNAITAFGAGIAAGGSVIVAKYYGAGEIHEAKKHANTSFVLALIVSLIAGSLMMIFSVPVLKIFNAPQEVIDTGLGYYQIQMLTTSIMAINSVYIGLEKAKGNTKLILLLNVGAMIIKLTISAVFVYGLSLDMMYVALATLIAQFMLMIVALVLMINKNNSFQLNVKFLSFSKKIIIPILLISLPVFAGKFMFSMGKVLINSMAAYYGPIAVAAFGVAMKLGGGPGSIAITFGESESSIVAQNLGNEKLKRAFHTYFWSQLFGIIVAIVGMIVVAFFVDDLIPIFTTNNNPEFIMMVKEIYQFEKWSAITSSSISIVLGLFVGFKLTKTTFTANIIRIFILRLPVLYVMQKMGVDYRALGYVMFISNLGTWIFLVGLMLYFKFKLQKYGYMGLIYDTYVGQNI